MSRRYRMRFVTLVLSLVLLMAMLLTGCGGDKPQPTEAPETEPVVTTESVDTEAPTDVPIEESTVAPTETEILETEAATEPSETEAVTTGLSDDLFSSQISIDGTVIQLPCNASDLAALGWIMEESKATSPLADGYTTGANVYHEDGSYMTLSIYNVSGDAVNFENCMVDDISIHGRSLGEHKVFIAKNLTIGSTKEDVIAAYGNEPSYKYESDDGKYSKLEYEFENFRNKIVFSFTDGIVSEIEVNTAG